MCQKIQFLARNSLTVGRSRFWGIDIVRLNSSLIAVCSTLLIQTANLWEISHLAGFSAES